MTRAATAIACAAMVSTTLIVPLPAAMQTNDPRIAETLERIRQRHDLPALGGAIVTSRGLKAMAVTGVRKRGTDIAVEPDDVWHLASDTKAMTAAWLAHIVDSGRLTWESTIGAVLPEQTAEAPEAFRKITLLQLLSHRAGLVGDLDWRKIARAADSPRAQRLVAVETAAQTPLASTPGSAFAYSNLGYVLAGAMGEQVVNRPWEEAIQSTLFAPLGMKSAGFGGLGTPGLVDQPWPHVADGTPAPANGPLVDNPEVMGPAATVHCSLADWATFVADQLRGSSGNGVLFEREMYTRLHTAPFGGDYAFGWIVTERPWAGGTVYTHAGSNSMNLAVAWVAPLRDVAVLVTTNQGGSAAEKGADEASAALIELHESSR